MRLLLTRLSVRELKLLLLGSASLLTAAMLLAIVVPNAQKLVKTNRAIALLEAAAVDGAELDRHLEHRNATIEDLRYRLHGDMATLPPQQIEAFIIGRLQKVSWNNDIELVSVEPLSGERIEVFQETLFNVSLTGKYRDLYRWLSEARTELGFVVVKEFELRRGGNDDTDPVLLATLSLASYRAVE